MKSICDPVIEEFPVRIKFINQLFLFYPGVSLNLFFSGNRQVCFLKMFVIQQIKTFVAVGEVMTDQAVWVSVPIESVKNIIGKTGV